VTGGFYSATDNADQVREWWRRWPSANIGLRPPLGVAVLDVDPRSGGEEQLVALQRQEGPLPPTLTARTGGNGLHMWYRVPLAPEEIRSLLAPGIDIKSHKGYLVVPPSSHQSGGEYVWVNGAPIVDAPEFLVRYLRVTAPEPRKPLKSAGPPSDAQIAGIVGRLRRATDGERSNILYWCACRFAELGVDTEPLVDEAVELGLSRSAAQRTARSAEQRIDRERE
jgi:hypothetical protein